MKRLLQQLTQSKFLSRPILSTFKLLGTFTSAQSNSIELIQQPQEEDADASSIEVTTRKQQEVFAQANITTQLPHGHTAQLPPVPRNIRVRHPLEDLFTGQAERRMTTDAYIARLMTAADRFACTTEMATFLAIMSIGGPQVLFYTDPSWDTTTRRRVQRIHAATNKGCVDDLELALKLYAAWSDPLYRGQPLAPAWALEQTWHPRRIPAFPTQMREALGKQATRFGKAIAQAFTYPQIQQLVEQYMLTQVAENWLQEVQQALIHAQQEAWSRAFFIHHELFRTRIEPERERLLNELEMHKREEERRAIHFDLLDKVRIIFAYCFSEQASIPYAIKTKPQWKQWLQQTEHSSIAVARFIAQQTREYGGDLLSTGTYPRLLLDHYIRLGSHYRSLVTQQMANGQLQVRLIQRLADTPVLHEGFRGAYTPPQTVHTPDISVALSLPMTQAETLSDRWPQSIYGYLRTENPSYQTGDTIDVEVIDYTFDDPTFPRVLVQPIPAVDPFDAFVEQYQIGDVCTVVVEAYDTYANESLVSLIVREPLSQLEILLEPERISFTPLNDAIQEIPLGTVLQVTVDDIDEAKRTVSLSSLPFMEVHLNKMLQTNKQEDGTYHVEARIRSVTPTHLSLIFNWSEPRRGLIYAVDVPLITLAEPDRTYHVGEICLLQLVFQDKPSKSILRRLPTEIAQMIDLQQGLQRLFWIDEHLVYHGRMSYGKYSKFLALSIDRSYQYALLELYRSSHQLSVEVIGVRTPTEADEEREALLLLPLAEETFLPLEQNRDAMAIGTIEAPVVVQPPVLPQMEEQPIVETLDARSEEEIIVNSEYVGNEVTQKLETPRATVPLGAPPIAKYHVGERTYGRVTGVKDFGAFVEIEPGVNGLVHKSKMWGYVADVRDIIRQDDMVEVIILAINLERGNMELSMQIPENNPLLRYHTNETIVGIVTDVQEFGAFVDIEPGVSGLVHKSKMWGFVPDARDVVQVGEEITVRVLSADLEKGGLELSMQVPEHDPLLRYHAGDIVSGIVTDVQLFGAFVEIEPGVSGLVYRTDIREGLTDARREIEVGEEVDVLIVRIDMEKRRLSLSMRDI